MGFKLWIEPEVAWAAGTYEYRAMGVAAISRTQLFRPRDFMRRGRLPELPPPSYAGHFASIGHMNQHLLQLRRRKAIHRRDAKSQAAEKTRQCPH